jgi:hypothetical protein
MKFKATQDPRQCRRFMLQFCFLLVMLLSWLAWRGSISRNGWLLGLVALLALALAACLQPDWFRGFYRNSMAVSQWLGDKVGRLILSLIFLLIMVPLGWMLRLAGYDPLALRKPDQAQSYWRPARRAGRLDQMF